MWPTTHAILAIDASEHLLSGGVKSDLIFAIASTWQDLPFLTQVALNANERRPLLEYNRPVLRLLNDMAHSLPVCAAISISSLLVTSGAVPVKMLALGWFSHIFIDIFTHGRGEEFCGDPDLWPWQKTLGSVLGIYNYRNSKRYFPKIPELAISALGLVVLVLG